MLWSEAVMQTGSLLLATDASGVSGTHFVNLGMMRDWVRHEVT